MTETERDAELTPPPTPDGSPFATPPIEGLPFRRDSEEAAAIKRILEKSAPRSDD